MLARRDPCGEERSVISGPTSMGQLTGFLPIIPDIPIAPKDKKLMKRAER